MDRYKSFATSLLNYIPSIIILIFSMLALHFSVAHIEEHAQTAAIQEEATHAHLEHHHGHGHAHDLHEGSLGHRISQVQRMHNKLYWAIIGLGLAGFVLVLLNTDKLRKIRLSNEEREKNNLLLQERLAAMEATLDGIGIIDADGNLTFMNKALTQIHGIKPRHKIQYLGQPWANIYDVNAQEVIKSEITPTLEREGFWYGETAITRKDNGEVVWVEISLKKLEDGGLISTTRDVTGKRLAQREHEQLQSQFYQAQKMEAIGRLAGGVAHDFNNILAAMNGYAEFLAEDLEDGTPQHAFALNILQAGKQARDLVDQILTFSRRNDSSSEIVDLNQAVEESFSFLNASMPKTIEISKDVDIDNAKIKVNPTQISQVIMNLCVNARDAMEDEHGVLKIGLKSFKAWTDDGETPQREHKNNLPIKIEEISAKKTKLTLGVFANGQDYICLSVADTGTGMPRKVMEHIFEPFFTTKAVDKGTGLGLATVHGVLLENKGVMVIESMVGQGTIFQLYFPVIDSEQESVKDGEKRHRYERSASVLVVEDQEQVREMLQNMFERMGHVVHVVEGASAALSYLQKNAESIDLVITDQNMPKMTGSEMAEKIEEQWPALPIILISGYSEEKLETILENRNNIKATLKKPVSKTKMADTLARVLERADEQNNASS